MHNICGTRPLVKRPLFMGQGWGDGWIIITFRFYYHYLFAENLHPAPSLPSRSRVSGFCRFSFPSFVQRNQVWGRLKFRLSFIRSVGRYLPHMSVCVLRSDAIHHNHSSTAEGRYATNWKRGWGLFKIGPFPPLFLSLPAYDFIDADLDLGTETCMPVAVRRHMKFQFLSHFLFRSFFISENHMGKG